MSNQVLVVDDESIARRRTVRMLDKIDGFECCGEAATGREALEKIESLKPDLLLLDIRMPGMSGMHLAEKLSERDRPPAVIFCTAYDQHMLEAFSASAVGYLVKPMRLEQLQEALERGGKINRLQLSQLADSFEEKEHTQHICIRSLRGMELIRPDAISVCEAKEKYVTLFHQGSESLTEMSLKQIESEYGDNFLRVHRNALVGVKFIEGLERSPTGETRVVVSGSTVKPRVSRRHLKGVKEKVASL